MRFLRTYFVCGITALLAASLQSIAYGGSPYPEVPVPATVTVPAGGNYSNLELTFSAGASGNTVVITATYGGSTTTAMVN